MAMMAGAKKSEDILGEKWDRCVADTLLKLGGGVAVGVVFSAIVFKRKTWPIYFGGGFGLGMSVANCQHEFRDPFNFKVKVLPKDSTPVSVESASPVITTPGTTEPKS